MLEQLIELYPDEEFMIADGLDDAIIGVDPVKLVVVYSIAKILEILMERDGMKQEEAIEFFDFNIAGSYVGERTPIWLDDLT